VGVRVSAPLCAFRTLSFLCSKVSSANWGSSKTSTLYCSTMSAMTVRASISENLQNLLLALVPMRYTRNEHTAVLDRLEHPQKMG
jgi:hypothetical protein